MYYKYKVYIITNILYIYLFKVYKYRKKYIKYIYKIYTYIIFMFFFKFKNIFYIKNKYIDNNIILFSYI